MSSKKKILPLHHIKHEKLKHVPVDHLLDAIEHAIILEDPTAVVFYPEIVLE